jgi:hypothetical protein
MKAVSNNLNACTRTIDILDFAGEEVMEIIGNEYCCGSFPWVIIRLHLLQEGRRDDLV